MSEQIRKRENNSNDNVSSGAGLLSVVATPIGNLEDISLRALRTLKEADLVVCEDTRMTARLLSRYDIHVRTMSYHAHSTESKEGTILDLLEEGKRIAIVSDAGTPGISDPGTELIAEARRRFGVQIENGTLRIEAIPGPSALTAALSVAGVPCADFTFLGFLPHKKGRETLFKEIADAMRTVVFYESPHRIVKALTSLEKSLAATKKVTIVRELSKIYEEVLSGSPTQLIEKLLSNPQKQKGEFVVIISAIDY